MLKLIAQGIFSIVEINIIKLIFTKRIKTANVLIVLHLYLNAKK